jgi:putative ABC transport system permease protein
MGGGRPVDLEGIETAEWDGIRIPQTMLVDEATDPKCGERGVGAQPEVREQKVRVVGHHRLGVGFLGDGSIVISDQTFSRLYNNPLSEIQMGLLRLSPGADPERAADRLRDLLPGDVRIFTKKELNGVQTRHWLRDTSLGIIFSMGTFVGIVIGMAILYQTLSTDILQQLPQYATLKSMGFPDRELNRMVLTQSLIFGFFGLAPATLLGYLVYWGLRMATNLPIEMTFLRLILVASIAAGMSAVSGVLATRKLMLADPADLF